MNAPAADIAATISYNSCRNRHYPKCRTGARDRWIEARRSALLPVPYVHVVFTLPPQLAPLAKLGRTPRRFAVNHREDIIPACDNLCGM